MPCEFCKSRDIEEPCVKLPGPKSLAVARQEPSRLIPTAIDKVIDHADVPLLQYAYSENMQAGLVGAMIKCLSSVYGLSLPTGPLRYAVLALSSLCLSGRLDVEPIQDYFGKTRVSLITRLASPHVVDETDLLATFILAVLESLRSPSREIRIYVQGCSSMLQALVSDSRVSVVLKIFGPLVFDYLSLIQFWSQSDPTETFRARRHIIFGQRNLFLQRLNYIHTSQSLLRRQGMVLLCRRRNTKYRSRFLRGIASSPGEKLAI